MEALALQSTVSLMAELVLALVVLAFLAWFLIRLFATPRPLREEKIKIVSRRALEPRRALYLVVVGERAILMGSSEAGLVTLMELDAGDLGELEDVGEGSLFSLLRGRILSQKPPSEGEGK